jgi:5'-nucleotidase
MGQIGKTIQTLVTAGLAASTILMAAGCAETPAPSQSGANGVRGDVTDVRPLATAAPASYQPPVYDTTGIVPTAQQAVTPEPSAQPASMLASVDNTAPMMSVTPAGKTLGEKTHTVRKGETLYSIARTSLGNGKLWKKIVAANPGVSASKLKVGQVLVMPS